MQRRITPIATLLWLSLWLGVIVPVHTRGGISDDACAAHGKSCCAAPADAPPTPKDQPMRHCAVCDLVARLDATPPPDLSLPPAGLALRLTPPAPEASPRAAHFVHYFERGPPTSA
ncbi:MAG: hypothetical protein GC162_00145 [Planctomycetes bacterium]|nr:hypothetical protein [Planctomycetota bacterium]